MDSPKQAFVAIAVMALCVFATRVAGPRLGAMLEAYPHLSKWLEHLRACVIAALVAPVLVHGDMFMRLGVVIAALTMSATGRFSASIFTGAAATALVRL